MGLFNLLEVNNFEGIRAFPPKDITEAAVTTIRDLDEREEMEPWMQAILYDTNRTSHGPVEIADVITHKLIVNDQVGMSAFVLKGRSFPTVRPTHVSHQIFRLERLKGLKFILFAASGNVLDEVKEQIMSTANRLDCDYCILDAHDLARLFVAFGFLCPRDGNRIKRGHCSCGYSPANRTSNILQQEALRELSIAHQTGQTSGAIILPTGSGKTRVAIVDAHRTNAKLCLYIAHSHEILASAEEEFLRTFPVNEVRRFDAPPKAGLLRKTNLITIQSLSKNIEAFDNLEVDYLIIDEFHHAAAKSYRNVVGRLKPKFLLGLTATPFRGDRQDVLSLCDNNLIVSYELRQGIEFGVLCPYHYYGCFDNIDYTDIRYNGNRYDIHDLEKALIVPERDDGIISKWNEKARLKPTLAFCCSHTHATRVAENFRKHGISAEVYLATTDMGDREKLREKLRRGKVKILCVVDILNEGVDLPFVECLLFLRPTESKRIFFQQLGRGLRRFLGKENCIVIDFIGNFKNAFRAVGNLGLEPFENDEDAISQLSIRSPKDVFNLPHGCTVDFDERVIDVFEAQILNPEYATRHTIARILIHRYYQVEKFLGKPPSRVEIDRNSLLDSSFYVQVFGSWDAFLQKISPK